MKGLRQDGTQKDEEEEEEGGEAEDDLEKDPMSKKSKK
jgi:hypothetical protein